MPHLRLSLTLAFGVASGFLLAARAQNARQIGADEVVRRCGEAHKKLSAISFSSRLKKELIVPKRAGTRRSELESTILLARPAKFAVRHGLGEIEESDMRSDGEKLTVFAVGANEYVQTSATKDFSSRSVLQPSLQLPPGTSLVLGLLNASDPGDFLRAAGASFSLAPTAKLNGRNSYVVVSRHPWSKLEPSLSPKTLAALKARPAELKLWIDSGDFLLRRLQVDLTSAAAGLSPDLMPTKFVVTETLHDVRVNPKTEPQQFSFSPPSGVKLVKKLGDSAKDGYLGQAAPRVELADTNGRKVALAAFKNRTAVLVNFWSSS